jgi:hypothetical protein
MGLLDNALLNFSHSGLTIEKFYSMAGGWRSNHESWARAEVPRLDLRFEDLVNFSSSKTVARLSGFLDIDQPTLTQAFEDQSQATITRKRKGSNFFNKAKSNYFFSYFSPKALKHFSDYNYSALRSMGYEELCDTIAGL